MSLGLVVRRSCSHGRQRRRVTTSCQLTDKSADIKRSLRWVYRVLIHRPNVYLKLVPWDMQKKNIYFQMRFQLYQSHSMTAVGLKVAKVHKLGLCGHFRDLKVTLKLKLQT